MTLPKVREKIEKRKFYIMVGEGQEFETQQSLYYPVRVPYRGYFVSASPAAVEHFADLTLSSSVMYSNSTPHYGAAQRIYIRLPKRKSRSAKPPVPPRFNPPELPLLKVYFGRPEPKSKHGKLLRRLSERKFEAKLVRRRAAREAYILRYNAKYEKFLIKKRSYELRVSNKSSGFKTKSVRKTLKDLPLNPFSETHIIDIGFTGYYSLSEKGTWSQGPDSGSWLPGAGPDTLRVKKAAGNFGDVLNIPVVGFSGVPILDHLGFSVNELVESVSNKAKSKFFENLKDQSIHVGQVLAERQQTFDLISDTARRLAGVLTNRKKAISSAIKAVTSKKGLWDFTGQIANDFLAFKFGVLPLLSDLDGACKEIANLAHTKMPDVAFVHARAVDSDFRMFRVDHPAFVDTFRARAEVSVAYATEYAISSGTAQQLSKFGLINPLEIAWELMPWSFVVDWLIPVGKYISSFTAGTGLSYTRGTMTVVTKTVYTTTRTYKNFTGNPSLQEYGHFEGTRTVKTKVRTVLAGPPVPSFPSFKNPLSVNHILLALALARQKVR